MNKSFLTKTNLDSKNLAVRNFAGRLLQDTFMFYVSKNFCGVQNFLFEKRSAVGLWITLPFYEYMLCGIIFSFINTYDSFIYRKIFIKVCFMMKK